MTVTRKTHSALSYTFHISILIAHSSRCECFLCRDSGKPREQPLCCPGLVSLQQKRSTLWSGVIISNKQCVNLFIRTFQIILYVKLHSIIGLKWIGVVGFGILEINILSVCFRERWKILMCRKTFDHDDDIRANDNSIPLIEHTRKSVWTWSLWTLKLKDCICGLSLPCSLCLRLNLVQNLVLLPN